jgi:hypothetical protein
MDQSGLVVVIPDLEVRRILAEGLDPLEEVCRCKRNITGTRTRPPRNAGPLGQTPRAGGFVMTEAQLAEATAAVVAQVARSSQRRWSRQAQIPATARACRTLKVSGQVELAA